MYLNERLLAIANELEEISIALGASLTNLDDTGDKVLIQELSDKYFKWQSDIRYNHMPLVELIYDMGEQKNEMPIEIYRHFS